MKKRFIRALITSVVVSSLFIGTVTAAPADDIASLESQKSAAQAEASSVSETLVSLLTEYQALETDISNQTEKIEQAADDLSAAEEVEKQQYEDMKLRIKYMYEEGDTNFFTSLFTAESFSDLISQTEYVEKVYNYDRQKLQEYVKTKEQVAELKVGLETEEAEMEDMAVEMESQQKNLQSTLDSLESQISNFDEQLEEARAAAAAELAAQKAAEEAAQKAAEEEAAAAAAAEEEKADETEPEEEEEEKEDKSVSSSSESEKKENSSDSSKKESSSDNSTKKNSSDSSKKESSSDSSKKESSSGSSGSSSSSSSSSSSGSSIPSNASLGQQIADKACEYVGGKYVYGGNSLETGVDCSGFVQQIHKLFGISTPRSSSEVRYGGKAVAWEDKLPGDVICYSGHVAIYIGNNQICHASNSAPYPKGGIKISSPANYRTVLAVRRYW